jgi:serpin B
VKRAWIVSAAMLAGCASTAEEAAPPPSFTADIPVTSAAEVTTTTGAAPASPPAVALAPSVGVERSPARDDAAASELAAGFNDAGFELLRTLPVDDNVVFSPTSIGHALLMAEGAANDSTRAAISAALGLPADAHDAWNTIEQRIAASTSDEVTVTIADRIWPRVGLRPDQAWIDLLASRHGADVVPLDFAADVEVSRQTINDWVGERTVDLIPELLPSGLIDPTTLLVLTDTLYFAADWQTPFGKYDPVAGTFTTFDDEQIPTSFMRQLELFDRRGAGDGFVGAELPYAGGEYAMLVLVPDEGRYEELLDRLDQPLLDEIDATFTTGPFELLLPTWEDSSSIDLTSWFGEIGAAPGSYPAIAPDAYIDAAVHAADITVDEHGTVAAAATAIVFDESGPPAPELTVAADRPFVYLIRHRASGLVLFLGHVTDPS